MEDKFIDQIIEILTIMNAYTPTTQFPANPSLPLINTKLILLKTQRLASKKKFQLNFLNIAEITKQISSIDLK